MISDILSDALHEIEEYQAACPDAYSAPDVRERIEICKAEMISLRKFLDTPPSMKSEVSK